jgi:hypothetical protein
MNGKIILTIVGLIAAIVAITSIKEEKEHFMGSLPSATWKVDRTVAQNNAMAMKGQFFSSPGTYQSMLSPRTASIDYGSNITYNMPSQEYLAVPRNPLTFDALAGAQNIAAVKRGGQTVEGFKHAKERYCACQECQPGCSGVPKCGTGGVPEYGYKGAAPVQEPGYANGNFDQMTEKVYREQRGGGQQYASQLPLNDMTAIGGGDIQQAPVTFDRYVFANRNSRLRGAGDKIRGDIAIVPAPVGWFRPSAVPNIDLEPGALVAMGGLNNDSFHELAQLMYVSSGGAQTALAGGDLQGDFNNVNMSSMYTGDLSAMGDVNVTAFP